MSNNQYEPWKELDITELEYFKMRYMEQRKLVHKAAQTLEFYADENTYAVQLEREHGEKPVGYFPIERDFGTRAREFLKELKNDGNL